MPRFGNPDPNEEPVKAPVAMDQLDPATKGAASKIDTGYSRPSFGSAPAAPQLSEAAQLASIELEKQKWEAENAKQSEDWMVKKWRPAMGWCYMVICCLDMAIFPVMWSVAQIMTKTPLLQWNPLTLQGAGLFHLAMGAVLGIAAWSRGQEKIQGVAK
jgi:Holin of 3TMs, for gene-transfer release